nr:GMC oxidoreductase [Streptomyces sp. HNM0575]
MDRYTRPLPATAAAAVQYAAFRRGPFASTVVEAGGFSYGNDQETTPDLQFHFLPAAGVEAGISAVRPGYGCTLNSYFLRPGSRGTVRVVNADPREAPLIDPNYLADDYDVEMAIEGVRQSRHIMEQPSMAPHIKAEHIAAGQSVRTKDDYVAFVRRHGRTAYHPVGTCAMGDSDQSVVSPSLTVNGLQRLRVVDSSVMPRIVSSNTQAPTVMIAEKASDMILEGAS